MRKLILQLATSLDGLIEGPNGEFDWCFTDQDYGMNEFLQQTDTIFFGRKSYDLFKAHIPSSDVPQEADSFWNAFLSMKQYVFSRNHQQEHGVTYISHDIVNKVKQIKAEPGKNIWLYGGASITTLLMNEGLVDELMLAMHPIVLGAGKPLFKDLNGRVKLQLKKSVPYNTGLVSLCYEVLPAS